MQRRVVITGFGCVTAVGSEPDLVWECLLEGQSGIRTISLFDASNFPVRIAAEVRDWNIPTISDNHKNWHNWSRQTQFASSAAYQAARSACLTSSAINPLRLGVYLGCGEEFPDFVRLAQVVGDAIDDESLVTGELMRAYLAVALPRDELLLEPGAAVAYISSAFEAQGPCANYTTACVSSGVAIGEAVQVIRRGDADVMFAGGAHSMIHPLGVTGLHRLSALSTRNDEPARAYRAFDRDRDGFVIGEGAAVYVLEELQHARQRGAEILAECRGFASTHDAYRITDPQPGGSEAARAMKMALEDAQLNIDEIDYINAHGSGTRINDKAETAAIKTAFGPYAYQMPVSSTKGVTGHLTTACAAIELFPCIKALSSGVVPPTINYETPDPDCDLDYVPNEARQVSCENALSITSGFGGHNVALVVSRFKG